MSRGTTLGADSANATSVTCVWQVYNRQNILKDHLHMPADKWDVHRLGDLWITAEKAVEFGLATEIAEFAPPPNAVIVNVMAT